MNFWGIIVGKRLFQWFTFTVACGLIPLVTSLLMHYFREKLTFDAVARSPEILFLSLMVSATALGDLNDVKRPKTFEITLPSLRSGLLVCVILSAILYGAFLLATVGETMDQVFASRIFWVSILLALLSTAVATTGEVFLGLTEK